ncbi:MAG: hypothetical protein MMC33_010203 [Icmadophila ericetorum]|nr:hypothetical protein [Icmadophila ericetorum]
MPPLSTPRRPSNRNKKKTTPPKPKSVDLGIPLGPYDSNSVRDRIRQWQSQGGGVITASDIYVEHEEEPTRGKGKQRQENYDTLSSVGSVDEKEKATTPKKQPIAPKTKIEPAEQNRSRSAGAPKKRVVSDEHWRKQRSPAGKKMSPKTTRATITPKLAVDDGIRVKPIPEEPPRRRQTRSTPNGKSERPIPGGDDGVRVYATPPGSRRESINNLGVPRENMGWRSDNSEQDRPSSRTSLSPSRNHRSRGMAEEELPEGSLLFGASAADFNRQRSTAKGGGLDGSPKYEDENSPKAKKPTKTKARRSSILAQVFDDSREIFSRPKVVPITTPRIPSVEAWLSETPDPFIDDDEPPVEIPLPLKAASKRKKEVQQIQNNGLENKRNTSRSEDSPSREMSDRKERSQDRNSLLYGENYLSEDMDASSPYGTSSQGSASGKKPSEVVNEAERPSPPPSLKRRGAKRDTASPLRETKKSSPLKQSLDAEDFRSAVSSELSASSVEPVSPIAELRPPGLNVRRMFPSTGRHRLSTIASVETFNTRDLNKGPLTLSEVTEREYQSASLDEEEDLQAEARDLFDPDALKRRPDKSRLTKHSDLISILSLPKAGSKSIQSARSIRTNRSRLTNATIGDLMKELATDESKYIRELRTLVDGVVPVLLTCVLSKSNSAVAAGLFSSTGNVKADPHFTRPIIDMGVALERMKSLHKRIPQHDPDTLLHWAQGAQKVYSDYLKAWRMGFQDVVVNLAPAAVKGETPQAQQRDELDEGLPRNEFGDVVNSKGERVDVAFLLKRPLVRLKYLAKTFKGINFLKPSAKAEEVAAKYQDLVNDARRRSDEERARLEDEAAASIDPTRARDIRTLGPLTGVLIDDTRRVRARDYFNMDLKHSTGQRFDCRIELLLRDNCPEQGSRGDLLICEVDPVSRWLLFPPVPTDCISARNGDLQGEIVIMLRDLHDNQDWHELLCLQNDDEQTGFEWVQMMGLEPVPPKVTRTQSFIKRQERRKTVPVPAGADKDLPTVPTTPGKSRTPSPSTNEVPIGERAGERPKSWFKSPVMDMFTGDSSFKPKDRTRLQKTPKDTILSFFGRQSPKPTVESSDLYDPSSDLGSESRRSLLRSPKNINEALGLAGTDFSAGPRGGKSKKLSKGFEPETYSPTSTRSSYVEDGLQRPSVDTLQPLRSGSPQAIEKDQNSRIGQGSPMKQPVRPPNHRSRSSVPSLDMPTIPKLRKETPPPTPLKDFEEEPEWPPPTPEKSVSPSGHVNTDLKRQDTVIKKSQDPPPPPPPLHKSPGPLHLKGPGLPDLSLANPRNLRRRSSSPLKHEYEPSTASASSASSESESDASTVGHNDADSVSDSSDDEESEDRDATLSILSHQTLQPTTKISPQGSMYSMPNGTLSPSQSASQAPYKRVPLQPNKASRAVASIFYWSEKGSWQSLHPDECSIVITPGLIEAFEMSAAHSYPNNSAPKSQNDNDNRSDILSQVDDTKIERPLIALELTPLVPIRRGTALDISVRSPPTNNSRLSSGNNVMFRSRSPEECEALYALINYSRINNPTYIALQNARATSSFTPSFDRSNTVKGLHRSGSWFRYGGGGRNSYRASSAPTPRTVTSESSVGSISSAFSALRRFSRPGGVFNVAKSTVTSRKGSRANSIYTTTSDHSGGSGSSTPGAMVNPLDNESSPLGISNAKIRLYIRENSSKWRDLGSARLTILRPTNASHPLAPGVRPNIANHKRILVRGKNEDIPLLDATLPENCFDRVARTGIAVNIWEAFDGGQVAKEGGVVGGSMKCYMIQVEIQMKSEMDAAYTFSIVGKLRY